MRCHLFFSLKILRSPLYLFFLIIRQQTRIPLKEICEKADPLTEDYPPIEEENETKLRKRSLFPFELSDFLEQQIEFLL